jgi:predicted MPP superfamily phosphohydrolase
MDDATSGIATIIILVIFALIVTQFLKPAPKRDRFLTDLERWVKNHKDKRISQYLEVHIERHFPEFVDWKKSQKR